MCKISSNGWIEPVLCKKLGFFMYTCCTDYKSIGGKQRRKGAITNDYNTTGTINDFFFFLYCCAN